MSNKLRTGFTTNGRKHSHKKGYIKVQWSQWNDGEMLKSDVKRYSPGSKELKVDLMEAVENWNHMMGDHAVVGYVDLDATSGKILDLRTAYGEEYEIWEVVK